MWFIGADAECIELADLYAIRVCVVGGTETESMHMSYMWKCVLPTGRVNRSESQTEILGRSDRTRALNMRIINPTEFTVYDLFGNIFRVSVSTSLSH